MTKEEERNIKKRLYVAEQLLSETLAFMKFTETLSLYSPEKGVTSMEEIEDFLKQTK